MTSDECKIACFSFCTTAKFGHFGRVRQNAIYVVELERIGGSRETNAAMKKRGAIYDFQFESDFQLI